MVFLLLEVCQLLGQLHGFYLDAIQLFIPVDTDQYLIFREVINPLLKEALQIDGHRAIVIPFIDTVGLGSSFTGP